MSYTDESKVEDYLAIDIDSSFSSRISAWAEAVDTFINNYTNKNFAELASEVRYFNGVPGTELDIDNFSSLSSVVILNPENDNTMYSLSEGKSSDYLVYPYNSFPKYRLILVSGAQIGSWGFGTRRVKITGDWNMSSPPKDIELAATMLLAGIIEKGLKGGSVQSESLGDYSVTFKDIDMISESMGVFEILDRYKIREL